MKPLHHMLITDNIRTWLKVTKGEKYPVYRDELTRVAGDFEHQYLTVNDEGQYVWVPEHFVKLTP